MAHEQIDNVAMKKQKCTFEKKKKKFFFLTLTC